MTEPTRVRPATTWIDLEFNGGEDATVELVVRDDDGVPVPLASAVATIAVPRCAALHTWTAQAGNLRLGGQPGQVFLDVTQAETAAWATTWGDAEWQLDVVDIFGHDRRPAEGDVRVNPSRRGAA